MFTCGLLDFVPYYHSTMFRDSPAYFFGFIALTPLTFVAFAIAHSTFHIHFTSFTLPAHSLRVGIPFNSMSSFHSIRLAHSTHSVPFHFISFHTIAFRWIVSLHSIQFHEFVPFNSLSSFHSLSSISFHSRSHEVAYWLCI